MDENIQMLMKDIEFGPPNQKMEAIGKLSLMRGVPLNDVQAPLRKVLESSTPGSRLRLYAAYTLASLGDTSDTVANAVREFMSVDPFEEDITFPWAANARNLPFHPTARWEGHRGREISPQITTMEAFSFMRGSPLAASALAKMLEHLDRPGWRLLAIYAAGANGDPSLRQTLEYLRDRQPGSEESQAAGVALEHLGRSTLLEIAGMHAGMAPKQETKKSGCFVATAVCRSPYAPEVVTLREFRDHVLAPNRIGRALISTYYMVSPSAAFVISRSPVLRAVLKKCLIAPIAAGAKQLLEKSFVTDPRKRY